MTSALIGRSLPMEALATTESDYLQLGETSARTELWDGGVLTCPRDTPRHQLILNALANALRANRTDLNVIHARSAVNTLRTTPVPKVLASLHYASPKPLSFRELNALVGPSPALPK